MKIIYFLPTLIFFISCSSIKIKELEIDHTQDLIGNVKSLNIITSYYRFNLRDTTQTMTEKSTIYFNNKNQILKERSSFFNETTYNYRNDNLESTVSTNKAGISKLEYIYDKNSNVIIYNEFQNDTLFFIKTSIYDSNNNPIERTYFHPYSKNINSSEKYVYDYKNKTVIIHSFDENNKLRNQYLKFFYDKRGFIIRTETINNNSNKQITSSINEYDKLGNLIKRINYNENNDEVIIYKNQYDKRGNIVLREKILKNKLIEKTIYEITYW